MTLSADPESSRHTLNESWTERLRRFRDFTLAHPRLSEAKEKVLAAIRESASNTLVMVSGPTGVGKTTLCARIEQILVQEMAGNLATDRATIPVVSMNAVSPESGNFNWRDHFWWPGASEVKKTARPASSDTRQNWNSPGRHGRRFACMKSGT